MTRPTDEELMAYADGTLDDSERAALARHLETDAEARAIVTMFQRTSALAREAFELPADAPALISLKARIRATPIRDAAAENTVVRVPMSRWRQLASQISEAPRLAAATLLCIGLASGWMMARLAGGPQTSVIALGEVARGSTMERTLETLASGTVSDRLMVVSTFRDRNARACREFEIVRGGNAPAPELAGVACRQPDGRWIVEGAARIATKADASQPGYVPSGAEEGEALASLLGLLGAGQALTAADEQTLLKRGWK